MKRLYLFLLVFFLTLSPALAAEEYGTFVKVVENASGSFDEVSSAVESGLKKAGWDILATFNPGVPEGCEFRSRVVVFTSQKYAQTIMEHGVKSAFALPLRAGIYEDETGIHVAVVNPASINRTIIGEADLDDLSLATSNSIVEAIAGAVQGDAVKKQVGQMRKKGRVGGMGGGDFFDKIEEVYKASDDDDGSFNKVVDGVRSGILDNEKNWSLIYSYDLSSYDTVVFGMTETGMEGRAFSIAGEKRSSKSYRFPGLDHGAAFPIEVIVYKEDGGVKVVTMDGMYRMKLYFEDAGMWAFIKNMGMPGDIEDDVVEISISQLDK